MNATNTNVKRMLIVEDEPAICDLCQRVLSSVYFEVDIAGNGKVAQGMIADKQYDLFLFDIKIPEMSGIELYQWLEEKHSREAKKVIFTTGSIRGQDTTNFIDQTGRPFLPKPFTPDELKTIVTETLKEVGK